VTNFANDSDTAHGIVFAIVANASACRKVLAALVAREPEYWYIDVWIHIADVLTRHKHWHQRCKQRNGDAEHADTAHDSKPCSLN
jgi:hypothetical protein